MINTLYIFHSIFVEKRQTGRYSDHRYYSNQNFTKMLILKLFFLSLKKTLVNVNLLQLCTCYYSLLIYSQYVT